MAAVFGVRKYREYLSDGEFTLVTDSRALTWLHKNKDTKSKLMRWSLMLQEYSFVTEHVPGKDNELADFLSRNPAPTEEKQLLDENRMLLPEKRSPQDEEKKREDHQPQRLQLLNNAGLYAKVVAAQRRSRGTQQDVLLWHDITRNGARSPQEHRFAAQHTVEDGLLWRRREDGDKLIVPTRYLKRVIQQSHDTPDAAHPGTAETLREVRRRYHHRRLYAKTAEHVRQCMVCASVKTNRRQKRAPLKPRTPTNPFEVLSVDTLGPYQETAAGNRFIIIVEDLFTKWVEATAVSEAEAPAVNKFLEEAVFQRYGPPKTIISDNGSVFHSDRYLRLCRKYDVTPYYTPVEHQRANQVERRVQELKKTLRTLLFTEANKKNWDKKLSSALRVLRSRRNDATGMTPAEALLGYQLPKAGDWQIPQYRQERNAALLARRNRRRVVRQHQLRFNERNYQQNAAPPVTFQVGDHVMAKTLHPARGEFLPVWTGPLRIVQKHSEEAYTVLRAGRPVMFHVDKLRPAPVGNPEPEDDSDEDPRDSSSDELTADEELSGEEEDEVVAPRPRHRDEDVQPGPSQERGGQAEEGATRQSVAHSTLSRKDCPGEGQGPQEREPAQETRASPVPAPRRSLQKVRVQDAAVPGPSRLPESQEMSSNTRVESGTRKLPGKAKGGNPRRAKRSKPLEVSETPRQDQGANTAPARATTPPTKPLTVPLVSGDKLRTRPTPKPRQGRQQAPCQTTPDDDNPETTTQLKTNPTTDENAGRPCSKSSTELPASQQKTLPNTNIFDVAGTSDERSTQPRQSTPREVSTSSIWRRGRRTWMVIRDEDDNVASAQSPCAEDPPEDPGTLTRAERQTDSPESQQPST